MKLSSAVLIGTVYSQLDLDDLERKNERSVAAAVGSLDTSSANKLASLQAGSKFPHPSDILFTQSQAAEFASMGVPVASHHISNAPAWKEQVETNARGVATGIMNGRLWQQHVNPLNCDVATDENCRYLIPFYYADGTTTQVRAKIETAMEAIEAKTCLQFQYLSNPRSFTYVNKKKLRVVTNLNLCSSYVGANLIEQDIYLSHHESMDCGLNARAVEHEILHAVGLYHENQRYDWDQYISYNWDNLKQTMTELQINTDYGVIPEEMMSDFGSAYQVSSIMHLLSVTNSIDTDGDGACVDSTDCVLMDISSTTPTDCTSTPCVIDADSIGETAAQNTLLGYKQGSLTDEDAWQINNMYGCTAFLDKYMFTCSGDGTHTMSHTSVGVDARCDSTGDNVAICTAAEEEDSSATGPCGACGSVNPSNNCADNATCTHDGSGNAECSCTAAFADYDHTTGAWTANGSISSGFTDISNGYSLISGGSGCQDKNECVDSQTCYNAATDTRLQCVNHDGGYECVCPPGQTHPAEFADNPLLHLTICTDLDECAEDQHGCPAHMACLNRECYENAVTPGGATVPWGQPCTYGEHNTYQAYECACYDQAGVAGTTGEYDQCADINQCADFTATTASNVHGTDICQMCTSGQLATKNASTGAMECSGGGNLFQAGLMCLNKDDLTDVTGYECRCPLGAEMEYYSANFFATLDEANGDNAVNGDMLTQVDNISDLTLPMANWMLVHSTDNFADPSNATPVDLTYSTWDQAAHTALIEAGEIYILIPLSYHGLASFTPFVNGANYADHYFKVSWDNTLKQWSSEVPSQCVDVEMCSRTKCPGRTIFGVGCVEGDGPYPEDQTNTGSHALFTQMFATSDELAEFFAGDRYYDVGTTGAYVFGTDTYYNGQLEGLPVCHAGECDHEHEDYNSLTNSCTDIDECDRWLVAEGETESIHVRYEKLMKVGSYTTAATVWAELTTSKDIYDTEGLIQDGSNGYEVQGQPIAMTCGATHAGSSVYSAAPADFGNAGTATTAQLSQLQCVNKTWQTATAGFSCECPTGSELAMVGSEMECVDIQECQGNHRCGTYPCIDYCRHGEYAAWDDAGACSVIATGVAEPNGHVGGGYTCECADGYEYDFNRMTCVDIDECTHPDYAIYGTEFNQNICETNHGSVCVNVVGDFYCACAAGQYSADVFAQFGSDSTGYVDPATCTSSTCNKADTNGASVLYALATTHLVDGLFDYDTTTTAQRGYCFGNSCDCGTGNQCANSCYDDDGELVAGMAIGYNCNECMASATCTNTDVGYTCSCPINSAQDGITACDDGNQCGAGKAGTLDCAAKGLSCQEEAVGYSCVCDNATGYDLTLVNGVYECVDKDECSDATICGEGNCANEEGTYSCTCYAGYDLVVPGRSLVAIPADATDSLKTSQGGRSPAGLVQDSWQVFAVNQVASQSRTGGRSSQFTCRDENECDTGRNHCVDSGFGGTCTNLEGSYSCGCAAGYVGDGADAVKYNALSGANSGFIAPLFNTAPTDFTGCVDIDECLAQGGHCHADATCVNIGGSFSCVCPAEKPLGDGVQGCFADPSVVPTEAPEEEPVTTAAPVVTVTLAPVGGITNDFNCAGQGMLGNHANVASDVAISCFGTSCGVQCVDSSKSPNVSGLFCQNTGKAKKQGWKNGNKKLSAGFLISCGAGGGSDPDEPSTGAGFCNMTTAMLEAKFGSNINFGKCKAGSKKCKLSCKNGSKPSPKKLKCKNGRLGTNSIRC
jgi:hypothetical protein